MLLWTLEYINPDWIYANSIWLADWFSVKGEIWKSRSRDIWNHAFHLFGKSPQFGNPLCLDTDFIICLYTNLRTKLESQLIPLLTLSLESFIYNPRHQTLVLIIKIQQMLRCGFVFYNLDWKFWDKLILAQIAWAIVVFLKIDNATLNGKLG